MQGGVTRLTYSNDQKASNLILEIKGDLVQKIIVDTQLNWNIKQQSKSPGSPVCSKDFIPYFLGFLAFLGVYRGHFSWCAIARVSFILFILIRQFGHFLSN